MNSTLVVCRRELNTYFSTPVAYVFLVFFLMMAGAATFYMGNFYERGQADLAPFFRYHPWLYLFLVPAVAMRLWAEERRSGTIELLTTLPLTRVGLVLGKFLAAWVFLGLALLLTFPLWITVNFLGDPDNGVIFLGYTASWFMAGAFLSIGCCMSALSKSQVVAFVLSVVLCFVFLLSGFPLVLNSLHPRAPDFLYDAVASLSMLSHFTAVTKGVLRLPDASYFVAFILFWLLATMVVVEWRKAD